jgi:hypothetical protein
MIPNKSIKGIQKNFINAKMIKKKEKNGALMKVV